MAKSEERVLEFSELLQQSRSRVFGFIYSLVLNMADTEDLFQQTAALLWEKFDEYESGTDFASWALRVARFKTSNFIRSQYRERKRYSNVVLDALYDASLKASDGAHEERLQALGSCIEKLPEKDRRLVKKCYGSQIHMKDLARTEGKQPNAIYTALHRARKNLLKCINRTLDFGGDGIVSAE